MPLKMNKIYSNFHYDPHGSLAVKLNRFFELKLTVLTEYCFVSSHSRMKSFALHKYHSYLAVMLKLILQSVILLGVAVLIVAAPTAT
jgi:hypothetical protein